MGAALIMGAGVACADPVVAPVAQQPAAFRLAAKNGIPIEQAADVGCEGILAGALQFIGEGDGRVGHVVVSHLVRRQDGNVTVVDTATFHQLGHSVVLRFPTPTGTDAGTPGVTATFSVLDDGSLETRGTACIPGEVGTRDVMKTLRYARTS